MKRSRHRGHGVEETTKTNMTVTVLDVSENALSAGCLGRLQACAACPGGKCTVECDGQVAGEPRSATRTGSTSSSSPAHAPTEALTALEAALTHTRSERDQLQARVRELEQELKQVRAAGTGAAGAQCNPRAAATVDAVTHQFELLGKALREACDLAGFDA